MGELIALVFIIWFIWYLIKISTKGNSSDTSKIDYRDNGLYGTRKPATTNQPSIPQSTVRPLTGKELLEKVKELRDVSKSDLVRACGYVSTKKDGGERLNFTDFYEALLDAKMGNNPNPLESASSEKLIEFANHQARIGKYDWAIESYTKAIEKEPENATAFFERGNAKYELEDYSGAVADHTKAIEINPRDEIAYLNCGNAKNALGDSYGAIADYNKAIEINPRYADPYHTLGLAKRSLEDYSGAIVDYDKAIELNANNKDTFLARAFCKFKLKDKKGSCLDYKKAASLGSEIAENYLKSDDASWCTNMSENQELIDLCEKQFEDGKFKEAKLSSDKLIALEPDNTFALIVRANCKDLLGDKNSAIEDFNRVIEIDPKNWEAYYNRGVTLRDSGDTTGAINDFTKSIELNPECTSALRNRGLLRSKDSFMESACSDWKKAADLGDEESEELLNKYCSEEKKEHSKLPISDEAFVEAFVVVMEVMTLTMKHLDKDSDMSTATFTTLWNIKDEVDPTMGEYWLDEHSLSMINFKDGNTVLDSLKDWIQGEVVDNVNDYDQEEMASTWDIGIEESNSYKDQDSFLSDLDWQMIVYIVIKSWEDSKSEETMEKHRKMKKVLDSAYESAEAKKKIQ